MPRIKQQVVVVVEQDEDSGDVYSLVFFTVIITFKIIEFCSEHQVDLSEYKDTS